MHTKECILIIALKAVYNTIKVALMNWAITSADCRQSS
jgi:hypothetical protein